MSPRYSIIECSTDVVALYSLTPTTEKYLVGSSPMSLRPVVTKIGDMYCIWQKLIDGIKDGE